MSDLRSGGSLLLALMPLFSVQEAGEVNRGGDWPTWGHDASRNMACEASGLPTDFKAGEFIGVSDRIDRATTENVRWISKLGSQSYGNPTIANGRVYVGTNNDVPRDKRFKGDRCVLNCLDEATGELIWQLNVPKLGTGKVSDWEFLGICSSPTVDEDRVYLVTNRCEVMCLDVNGMADGNQGFADEGLYAAWPEKEPLLVEKTDADILWILNMIDECGVFPHNITTSAVLVVDDALWVTTSNGVDYGHVETPAPFAPCLIKVDKMSGALIGEEASGLSQRIFHSNWTSPAYLRTGEEGNFIEQALFGGPDGFVYAFDPKPVEDEDGYLILKESWRCDANRADYRVLDGKKLKYATRKGPSEVLSTVVSWGGRVYASIGQDPEHGEGLGRLVCIDPSGSGDVSETHVVWSYDGINRSMSTPSIADGLIYVADYSGFIYCLDALTGELQWRHDTMAHIWGSTLVADGKVYIGNEDGYLTILPAGRTLDPKKVVEVDMTSPVYSSPVAANGVLYVATHTHLFAIEAGASPLGKSEKEGE
jgi:outer membrane protein assembly factor BamB